MEETAFVRVISIYLLWEEFLLVQPVQQEHTLKRKLQEQFHITLVQAALLKDKNGLQLPVNANAQLIWLLKAYFVLIRLLTTPSPQLTVQILRLPSTTERSRQALQQLWEVIKQTLQTLLLLFYPKLYMNVSNIRQIDNVKFSQTYAH